MATTSPKEKEQVLELSTAWGRDASERTVLRQLTRRFKRVPKMLQRRINRLSERMLQDLAEDLLDFKTISDAQDWVADRQPK